MSGALHHDRERGDTWTLVEAGMVQIKVRDFVNDLHICTFTYINDYYSTHTSLAAVYATPE